jgi:hypothetical protein
MKNIESACYITHNSKRTIGRVLIMLQDIQYPYNLKGLTQF